jgi:hypothetical protein
MCQAFSGLITKSGKVYWKLGVDSHDDEREIFAKEDPELRDDKMPPNNTFARFEILPKNGNYFSPDKWVFELDERIEPSWWTKSLEKPCFEAHRQWLEQLYSLVRLDEVRHPINPLTDIPERKRVTKKDLAMLEEWSLVWESAGKTIRDSVWHARGSVWNPIWESLWRLVGRLVWNSEWRPWKSINILGWAYVGSLLKTHDWKHIDWRKKPFNKIGKGNYPFRSGEYLWRHGLVPSFDGKVWRLHTGPKAKVIWKGKL